MHIKKMSVNHVHSYSTRIHFNWIVLNSSFADSYQISMILTNENVTVRNLSKIVQFSQFMWLSKKVQRIGLGTNLVSEWAQNLYISWMLILLVFILFDKRGYFAKGFILFVGVLLLPFKSFRSGWNDRPLSAYS